MVMSGFATMGLIITLLFVIVGFAVISFIIRYSIDNSRLTKEIMSMRKDLEEIKNDVRNQRK